MLETIVLLLTIILTVLQIIEWIGKFTDKSKQSITITETTKVSKPDGTSTITIKEVKIE